MNDTVRTVAVTELHVAGQRKLTLDRSIVDNARRIAARLGLERLDAFLAGSVPVSGPPVRTLVLHLREVQEFARTADVGGWAFGQVRVAPREQPIVAAAVPGALLWCDPIRGFALQQHDDVPEPVSESGGQPVLMRLVGAIPARAARVNLAELLVPLATLLSAVDGATVQAHAV